MVTDRRPFIATYIQANRPFGTLYVGMTSDLLTRANDHRYGRQKGFTSRYGCSVLVWFEQHDLVTEAIRREKALKSWNRPWKVDLIEKRNPDWANLYPWLCGEAPDPRAPLETPAEGSVEHFLARLARGEIGEP